MPKRRTLYTVGGGSNDSAGNDSFFSDSSAGSPYVAWGQEVSPPQAFPPLHPSGNYPTTPGMSRHSMPPWGVQGPPFSAQNPFLSPSGPQFGTPVSAGIGVSSASALGPWGPSGPSQRPMFPSPGMPGPWGAGSANPRQSMPPRGYPVPLAGHWERVPSSPGPRFPVMGVPGHWERVPSSPSSMPMFPAMSVAGCWERVSTPPPEPSAPPFRGAEDGVEGEALEIIGSASASGRGITFTEVLTRVSEKRGLLGGSEPITNRVVLPEWLKKVMSRSQVVFSERPKADGTIHSLPLLLLDATSEAGVNNCAPAACSVLAALHGLDISPTKMRETVVEVMRQSNNQAEHEGGLQPYPLPLREEVITDAGPKIPLDDGEYYNLMAQDGAWWDDCCLQAAHDVLGLPLVVHAENRNQGAGGLSSMLTESPPGQEGRMGIFSHRDHFCIAVPLSTLGSVCQPASLEHRFPPEWAGITPEELLSDVWGQVGATWSEPDRRETLEWMCQGYQGRSNFGPGCTAETYQAMQQALGGVDPQAVAGRVMAQMATQQH